SSMAEAGNVGLLRAPWNTAYLDELASFPQGQHDDMVDASSLAFTQLSRKQQLWFRAGGETVTGDPPGRRGMRSAEYVRGLGLHPRPAPPHPGPGEVIITDSAAMGRVYTIAADPGHGPYR